MRKTDAPTAQKTSRPGAADAAVLAGERRDYAVPQEMGHGPITAPKSFSASEERLCEQIRASGAVPAAKGWDYDGMANRLDEAYRKAALDNRALLADMGTAPAPRHS